MGHHNIRFDGDPYALQGAWSPPTSRANFCEEDYNITFWIAEFINSVSNITYVWLALRQMYGPRSRGWLHPDWDFMSLSLFGLGFGSFLFHASMRQTLEFVDELSMLVLAWSMLYSLVNTRQDRVKARIYSAVVAIAYVGFSVYYVITAKIIYQVIAFFVSLGVISLRIRYLVHWQKPAFALAKIKDWTRRAWKASAISLFGYLLWNIDLNFCAELRAIRQTVGLPWAFLFELHGWWHIFTAIGAAHFMSVVREVRREGDSQKKE